ncbi:hypothetical protein HY573_01925, partial [Candidatus Parcubacteria bacterium]|nr:hypothetical protein [Candidatus Parcubacteria bacterium]
MAESGQKLQSQNLPLREAAQHTGYSQGHLTLLLRLGHLSGKKVGRRWYTTPAALARYQRAAIAAAGAALAEPATEHAPASSFWKELREEFKALEVSFAIPKELSQFVMASALVVGLLGVFDVPRFVRVSLAEGLEVGTREVATQSAALGAAWLTAPQTGLDFAHAAGGIFSAASQSVSGLLRANGAAVSASLQASAASFAQADAAFRSVFSFAQPRLASTLALVVLAGLALALMGGILYFTKQFAGAPAGVFRHLAQDRLRDVFIGLSLVTTLSLVLSGTIGGTRTALEELTQGKSIQGDIVGLESELTKLKASMGTASLVEGVPVLEQTTEPGNTQTRIREITTETTKVEERIVERQVTVEPADLTGLRTSLAATASDVATLKGQLQGVNGTVTSHIVTVTAPANLPTNKLLTLTAGLTVKGNTEIENLTVNGSAACSAANGSCNGVATAATGWTDDGTTVRLTTATDSVGIGLTNPTSTLSILGSFAINPGASTDTFGIASTGQITASSTVSVSNFLTASASSLTAGDFIKGIVNLANHSGNLINFISDEASPTTLFRIVNSATATSTLRSGLIVDSASNTFAVNANENRVGIGTNVPSTTLGVLGASRFNGSVAVAGVLTVDSCVGCAGSGGAWQSIFSDTAITPTSTSAGIYVRASSTIDSTLRVNNTLSVNSDTATFFSVAPATGLITASSTATASNFFTASATAMTSGDLFRGVLGAPATGNFLSFTQGELANGHRFKLDATGIISASSTAATNNFFTASATAITSGDLFRGVLGAGATADANFLSFSMGETPNNRRFALNSQGSISASSTVTGTNFFNVTATAITTGDLFKFTVPGTTGTGQAWTGNILTVQNNTTSLNVTTPQTLLTIS